MWKKRSVRVAVCDDGAAPDVDGAGAAPISPLPPFPDTPERGHAYDGQASPALTPSGGGGQESFPLFDGATSDGQGVPSGPRNRGKGAPAGGATASADSDAPATPTPNSLVKLVRSATARRRSSILRDIESAFVTEKQTTRLLFFFNVDYSEKFIHFVNHMVFAALLVAYLYAGHRPDAYWQTYSIDTIFVQEYWAPRMTFLDVRTPQHWFDWAQGVLVPALLPTEYNNGAPVPPQRARYVYSDAGLRLGQARLRQVRVRSDACELSRRFTDSLGECNAVFAANVEETAPWEEMGGLKHTSASESDQTAYIGASTLTTYPGGGYITLLPNDAAAAAVTIETLYNATWIDQRTRVVFVEFTVFNPATRLFTMATLAAEVTAAGELVPSRYLRTLDLLGGWALAKGTVTAADVVGFALLVALYSAVLMRTLTLAIRMVRRRKELAHEPWTWVNALNLCLFWVQFGMGLYVSLWLIANGSEEFTRTHGFARLFSVSSIYESARSVMAFNAALTLLLFFEFVGFSRGLNQVNETFTRSWRDLTVVMVLIVIVVLGYAFSFMLTFGKAMEEFRNFSESCATLFISVLTASMDVDRLRAVQPMLGPFLYVTFIVLMVMVVLSMIFAVINQAFETYRLEGAAQPNDPMFRDMLRAGQWWIKLAYRTPVLKRVLPGTERSAINRFFLFTQGRLVVSKHELDATIDVDDVLRMDEDGAGVGGAPIGRRAPGHGWHDDGHAMPLPEKPRVALLKELRDLDEAQRALVQRLETAVVATRSAARAGVEAAAIDGGGGDAGG